MALIILRCLFLMVSVALAFRLLQSDLLAGERQWLPWVCFLGVLAVLSSTVEMW